MNADPQPCEKYNGERHSTDVGTLYPTRGSSRLRAGQASYFLFALASLRFFLGILLVLPPIVSRDTVNLKMKFVSEGYRLQSCPIPSFIVLKSL